MNTIVESTPPTTASGRTRVVNQPALVDVRLPAGVRRRRLTLASVSAVCTQLGEHVTVRNVQRVLGGSLRDIAPLVRAWRSEGGAGVRERAQADQVQALGGIVVEAIDQHGEALSRAHDALSNRLARLEQLMTDQPARAQPTALKDGSAAFAESAASMLAALNAACKTLLGQVGALAHSMPTEPSLTKAQFDAGVRQILDAERAGQTNAWSADITGPLLPIESQVSGVANAVQDLANTVESCRDAAQQVGIGVAEQVQTATSAVREVEQGVDRLLRRRRLTANEVMRTLWPLFDDRLDELYVALTAARPAQRSKPSPAVTRRLDALSQGLTDLRALVEALPRRGGSTRTRAGDGHGRVGQGARPRPPAKRSATKKRTGRAYSDAPRSRPKR